MNISSHDNTSVVPAPVIEFVPSSSSAARAAPTRNDRIDEQLTNILGSYKKIFFPLASQMESIEKETEKIALLAKRCAEGLLQPSLTSPTDSEQVPWKRHRRTLCTTMLGIMDNPTYLAPSAWLHTRHA